MLKHLDSIFKKIKLGKQVTTLLLLVLVVEALFSGITLFMVTNSSAQAANTSKAITLSETLGSVRRYIESDEIEPFLSDTSKSNPTRRSFSAYSAQQVFKSMSTKEPYKDFIYREAMIEPTEHEQTADEFEKKEIVEPFLRNLSCKQLSSPNCKALTGRSRDNQYFYVARPLRTYPIT